MDPSQIPGQQGDWTPPTDECTAEGTAIAPWQSKTLWVAVLTAVVPLIFPPAGAFVAANPELVTALLGAGFAGLRCMSKKPVTVKKPLPPEPPKS